MKLLWLAPVCVFASIGLSLLDVWSLSTLTGLKFNPTSVAALSGAITAAMIAIKERCGVSDDA
jgi:hypothetical protein